VRAPKFPGVAQATVQFDGKIARLSHGKFFVTVDLREGMVCIVPLGFNVEVGTDGTQNDGTQIRMAYPLPPPPPARLRARLEPPARRGRASTSTRAPRRRAVRKEAAGPA
jgi:hypothetical protein